MHVCMQNHLCRHKCVSKCVYVCVSVSQREKWGYNYSTTDKIMTNCSDFPSEPSKFLFPFMSTLPFFLSAQCVLPPREQNQRKERSKKGVKSVMDFFFHTATVLLKSVHRLVPSNGSENECDSFSFEGHYPEVMFCDVTSFQSKLVQKKQHEVSDVLFFCCSAQIHNLRFGFDTLDI